MARAGGSAAHDPGDWASHGGDAVEPRARAGYVGSQSHRQTGGCRAAERRQRHTSGAAADLGRAQRGARDTLHGGTGGDALQSDDPCVLCTPVCGGQAEEAGAGGMHAQTAADREQRVARSTTLEGSDVLTSQTVASRGDPRDGLRRHFLAERSALFGVSRRRAPSSGGEFISKKRNNCPWSITRAACVVPLPVPPSALRAASIGRAAGPLAAWRRCACGG